jgi:NADH dehydrogenase/NADH:ubiquinone oxidoreductase subunit G
VQESGRFANHITIIQQGGTLLKEDLIRTIREAEHLEFFKYQVAPQYQQKSQLIQVLERSIRWKHLDIVNRIQQDGILTKRLFHQLNNKDTAITDRRTTLTFVHHVLIFAGKDMEPFASSSFIRYETKKECDRVY